MIEVLSVAIVMKVSNSACNDSRRSNSTCSSGSSTSSTAPQRIPEGPGDGGARKYEKEVGVVR